MTNNGHNSTDTVSKKERRQSPSLEQLLNNLQEANLLSEYHHLRGSLAEFQRLFYSLEVKYAQVYAQVAAVEQRISDHKLLLS